MLLGLNEQKIYQKADIMAFMRTRIRTGTMALFGQVKAKYEAEVENKFWQAGFDRCEEMVRLYYDAAHYPDPKIHESVKKELDMIAKEVKKDDDRANYCAGWNYAHQVFTDYGTYQYWANQGKK